MWKNLPYAIFDMDGTLLDSMPYWHSLGSDYLRAQGKDPEPDLLKVIAPMSLIESSTYFRDYYGVEGTPESIKDGLNDMMRDNYRFRIPAKPGVPEYLEKLDRRGIKMCICSATAVDLADAALTRLGIRKYFTDIISCDEVGCGKNRPEVFLLTLDRIGAKPEECVMYEDSFFAMETARSVGLAVVGVYDPHCKTTPEETAAFCDGYIRSFSDVLGED